MADSNGKNGNAMTSKPGMMDGGNKCMACGVVHGGCCGCGACNMGYCYHGGWGWKLVRIVIALIILGIVFSMGVLLGEVKMIVGGGFDGGFGRVGMMRGYYGAQGVPTTGYYPMMGGFGGQAGAPAATSTGK